MEIRQSRTTFRLRLDTMVQQLREGILTGKYPAGSYLPSEDQLGEQFQLSKKSVRKGLELLVEENLIIKKPKIGNMVSLPNEASDKISIRFCYYPNSSQETNISSLLDEFERQYPHIQVKRMNMDFLRYPSQAIEFMNDQMLDVLMINYNHFRYFVEKDALHHFAEQTVDKGLYSFLNRGFTIDGQLYAKPFVFSPVILCYNKKHFKEAELREPDSSWTWKEFSEAAARLEVSTPYQQRLGFYFHLLSQNRWPLWLLQNGFSLQKNDQGAYHVGNEVFNTSIEMIKKLFSQQQISPAFVSESDFDTEQLFFEEKTSMIITTYFSLNNLKDVPFEYNISPVPFSNLPFTLLLNIGLAINHKSTQKEAAQLLVDFLTSKETQENIRETTLTIPSMKEVAELDLDGEKQEPTRFQMFREIIPSFRYYTDMNVESNHLRTMTQYLKLYWSNMETSANVVCSIEQALNHQTAGADSKTGLP